jgi:ribonuclease HI
MARQKWYVVLKGKNPGIYAEWEQVKMQVLGFPGAVFRGFASQKEAAAAWESGSFPKVPHRPESSKSDAGSQKKASPPSGPFLVVDAACSGVPGPTEYQGFHMPEGRKLFSIQVGWATNNIGEFLAIVHALAMLKQQNSDLPVYSDSATAISWVRQKMVKSNLKRDAKTSQAWQLVDRAIIWLKTNSLRNPVRKWETKFWGENPADFGRK